MAHSGAGSSLKKRVFPPVPISPQVKAITTPYAVAAAAPAPQSPTSKPKPKPTTTTKAPAPAPVPTKSTVITTTTIAITTATESSTIATATEISISTSTLLTPLATDGSQQGAGPITTEPNSKSAANPGLIAGIVGSVVVIVILIAGLLFRVKKKRGREARAAELYQQQSMMNKYSEGSSAIGYGDGSNLSLQQQQVYPDNRRQQNQQPEWFAKKSALEYHSQVPPMDELKRQKMEQQEQKEQQQQQHERWQRQRPGPFSQESNSMTYTSSSSNPFTQHGAPITARSFSGGSSSAEKTPEGESIALIPTVHSDHPLTSSQPLIDLQSAEPYKQHQYQQPRVSTHGLRRATASTLSPTSPPPSLTSNNPFSPHLASATADNYSLSPTLGSPTATPVSNNAHHTYTPPPPPPPSQYTPPPLPQPSQPSQPSPGFYDFLLEDDDLLGTSATTAATTKPVVSPQARSPYYPLADPLSPKTPVSPPPIPRATRPISVASTSSFKLITTDGMLDPSAPAVPALPRSP
ncbi:hypothetical protein BGZ51_001682 [Haplosporangium sp. Z 767]|nr:hypothetical protein BGZ51_001682 [Haplosporangium sp. Z 767]KAF9188058.1 hypothetical protein BGZ50_001574 [Haplosporangium sp. Z 11]